jgi:hypothetical protein
MGGYRKSARLGLQRTLILFSTLLFSIAPAAAQTNSSYSGGSNVGNVFQNLYNQLDVVVYGAALVVLVWSGLELQLKGGTPEAWQNAKTRVLAVVIAVITYLLSPWIVNMLAGL